MKTAAVLAFLIAIPSWAHAESPPQALKRHEVEARKFLGACKQKADFEYQECIGFQQRFVEWYVRGLSGDFQSMWLVSGFFKEASPGYMNNIRIVAVPPRPIEACAWAYLTAYMAKHSDIWEHGMHEACDPLENGDHPAVKAVLRKLANTQHFDVPASWHPVIRDARPKPVAPVLPPLKLDDKCLITTVPSPDDPPPPPSCN